MAPKKASSTKPDPSDLPAKAKEAKVTKAERPQRNRKAPSRLADEPAPKTQGPKPEKKKTPPKSAAKKISVWDTAHLLHHQKSRLLRINLVKLLTREDAWEPLSPDERAELTAMLPEGTEPRLLGSDTPAESMRHYLRSNDSFKGDVALFKSCLGEGRLDPEWQAQAAEAMEMRAKGEFDEWKEREFEEYWGQKAIFHPVVGQREGKVKGTGEDKGLGKGKEKEEGKEEGGKGDQKMPAEA
ncbi:MAG: hypothetical protein M1820_002257 [Bogoriella megaspora]|nr:MAG: hypothetical protein M1820_002257 [Bogoriella megaspora]